MGFTGGRATKKQLEATIEKHRKRAFDSRQLVVITNQAYMIPGTYHLGRVQIYDVRTKRLLMRAPNNYTAIKMLEDGFELDTQPSEGFFKLEGVRRRKQREQKNKNISNQEKTLRKLRKEAQ